MCYFFGSQFYYVVVVKLLKVKDFHFLRMQTVLLIYWILFIVIYGDRQLSFQILDFDIMLYLLTMTHILPSSILWNINLISLAFSSNFKIFLKVNFSLQSKFFKEMEALNLPIINLEITYFLLSHPSQIAVKVQIIVKSWMAGEDPAHIWRR